MNIDFLKKELEKHISSKRLYHSECVAKRAVELADLKDADRIKAEIAGLIHDICKEMPLGIQLKYLKEHDILLDIPTFDNPPVWHGITASVYLKEELGIDDEEILSAVKYHTIGKADMSLLEEIVFIADYTSDDRNYPSCDMVKKSVDIDWDLGIFEGLKFGMQNASEKNKMIIRETCEGYNYYLNRVREKELEI